MPRAILLPPVAPALWALALLLAGLVDRPGALTVPVLAEIVLLLVAYGLFLVLNLLLAMPFAVATVAVTRHPAAALLVALAVGAAAAEVALRAELVADAYTLLDGSLAVVVAGPAALLGAGTFHFLRLRWLGRGLASDG